VFSGACTSRCPEKPGTGECGTIGENIFFPPAGADVAIPGIFRWNEVPGRDTQKLVESLKWRHSPDLSRADLVRKEHNVITLPGSGGFLPDTGAINLTLTGAGVRVEKNGKLLENMTAEEGEHGMIISATIGLRELLYGKEPFNYYVFIPGEPPPDATALNVIRTIIEDQRPAHTCFGLRVLEPWFCLDRHTYLGINTALTQPSFLLGKESVLGRDTVLGDREEGGQIGYHSQIGVNAKLT
jgi:hypothetical protein